MNTITEKEYHLRLSAFVAQEKAKLPIEKRPQGVFSNWDFTRNNRRRSIELSPEKALKLYAQL